ncbi:toxin-antitoxin system YwqK family antitoxin [Nitrospina sp. 32_T5]|uniref:toxin-antitoxin system YwqK family antitoxin n=1 Tax=unclassified Nitrospina TaxID=2638683 RepID=UPI003F9AAD87
MIRFAFMPASLATTLLWLSVACPVPASAERETVVQSYPNGAVHFEIQIDENRFRQGWTREFRRDGSLMSEYMYEHGVKQGLARFYYDSGELMTVWVYENGQRHGQSIGYFKNGAVKDRGFYQNDLLHGPVTLYHPDGTVKAQLEFKEGRRHGESKTYYEDGQVQFVYRHDNDRMLESEHYGRDGQLLEKQYYPHPGGR